MTVRAFIESNDPTRIDVDNKIDPRTGVRYLGHAWHDKATGRWLCLADVGALCIVEVRLIVDGTALTPIGDATQASRAEDVLKVVSCAEKAS